MKGQAFITLPSEAKAKKALRDAHGYILHGKPMVIVSLNNLLYQIAYNSVRWPEGGNPIRLLAQVIAQLVLRLTKRSRILFSSWFSSVVM